MSTVAATGGGSATPPSTNLEKFTAEAKNLILDLGTNDSDIIKFVSKHLSGDSSPEKRTLIERFLDMRNRAETSLSQIIRLLGEAARSVINNIR